MKKGDVLFHRYNKRRTFYFDREHDSFDWIYVIDDKGLNYFLPLSDFFTIKEIRKIKLKKIYESTL